MEKCRICMLDNTVNKCINITKKLNEDTSILEGIVTISFIEVLEKDILPQFICNECYATLGKFYDFWIQIRYSDKLLKEQLSGNHYAQPPVHPVEPTKNFNDVDSLVNEEVKSESQLEHKENIPTILEASTKVKKKGKLKKKITVKAHRNLECPQCLKTFKKSSHLEAHNAYKHLERKFECKLCNKKFARKYDLTYHSRCHTGEKPYTCEICGKSFASSGYFLIHKKLHKGERKVMCSICQHRFINTDQLQIHIRQKHTGERPYMCELCSHAFASSSALSRHKRDVHNEKEKCPICSKLYSTRVLKDHMKRHKEKDEGLKKYSCSQCGNGFTSATSRNRHMIVHSGEKPFKCEVCDKSFNQRSTLQTHMRIHSQTRRFGCNICSKGFKFKHHLKLHYEKYHKGETFTE